MLRNLVVVTILMLWMVAGSAANATGEQDLALLSKTQLKDLKGKYERKRAKHQKKIPGLKKQLTDGSRTMAHELFPLQAKLQAEMKAVEEFDAKIEQIEIELGSRKINPGDLAKRKAAARQRFEAQRAKEDEARRAARQRREAEEQSYKTKLDLLDAELERRDSEETQQRISDRKTRRYILIGLAVGLVLLAAGVIVFIKTRR